MGEQKQNYSYWAAYGAIFSIAIALYVWLIPHRWISPDEGAHLMSAKRILFGEVPFVDYGSRQPLYCYIHALFQAVLGQTLTSGRIVSMLFTLTTAILVSRAARMIGGPPAGPVAAGLFLFSSLTVHYSTAVQTQPIVMCLTLAAVLAATSATSRTYLAAGVLLACGFYVRESALAVALALMIYLIVFERKRGGVLRLGGPLVCGFLAIVVLVFAYFGRWLSFEAMWHNRLNPIALGLEAVEGFLGAALSQTTQDVSAAGTEVIETLGRPSSGLYLAVTFKMIMPLILVAAVTAITRLGIKTGETSKRVLRMLLISIMTLAAFYGYWMYARGFFPGYAREFEPLLAIIGGAGLAAAGRQCSFGWLHAGVAAILLAGGVLTISDRMPVWIESLTLAGGAAFIMLVLLAAPFAMRRHGTISLVLGTGLLLLLFALRRAGAPLSGISPAQTLLVGLALFIMATVLSLYAAREAIAGRMLVGVTLFGLIFSANTTMTKGGVSYQAPWHPDLVREVVEIIKAQTEPDEEVMSGGMIWSYAAGRMPFLRLNHPLGSFREEVDGEWADFTYDYFRNNPPGAVVLDDFTQMVFYKSSAIQAELESWRTIYQHDEDSPVTILLPPIR